MNSKVPTWATPYLNQQQQTEIINLIKKAETKTNGEILPIVANKSTVAPFLFYFNFSIAIILVLLADALSYLYYPLSLDFYIYNLIAAPFLAIIFGQSKKWFRYIVPQSYQKQCVHEKAMLSFYHNITEHTEFQTGVLIYVSVLEQKVEILADKAIAKKLPADIWQKIVNEFIVKIKSGEFFDGLKNAINECSQHLEEHFPKSDRNTNEIKDAVIFHQH